MGKPTGFLEFDRELPGKRDPKTRIDDYKELFLDFEDKKTNQQAARCMDCGVPFCHTGCPLGNIIPEFNDAVYNEDWKLAVDILQSTNNFPEFTGRICPAPCESACVLGINKPPVAIEHIEKMIIEKAFSLGLVKPNIPRYRSGKKVAIVGSGPSGLAAAAQLNKAGHTVIVFERSDRIGGLLRYGIPDFKLEKQIIDRRLEIMKAEGITFKTKVNIGVDLPFYTLINEVDAVVLCGGSTKPRDLRIRGRNLNGVHYAMEFLTQQNKRIAGDTIPEEISISAEGKDVIVIGGGDTGSDCVGTSKRHMAKSVTQIELLAKPPFERSEKDPWPKFPMILRTSTSHEEGVDRQWSILTKEFIGDENGNVKSLRIVDIKWDIGYSGKPEFKEIKGTERDLPCDLALLAIGFVHGETDIIREKTDIELDARGNISTNNYRTNIENVFAAGDMRRGQSLVVWAITEGREAAREVDKYLMKEESLLEARDESQMNVYH
ncbi:MAG: glutamate synthase subunit beta [Cyclobacteriaceae bacterium]|nr:glutamate synthase subunit beta [Cyclobacteriaceae bacterium]